MTATYRKPTMNELRAAVELRRQARELKADARRCSGKSAQDRNESADLLLARAMWLAGKISNEAYRAYLS